MVLFSRAEENRVFAETVAKWQRAAGTPLSAELVEEYARIRHTYAPIDWTLIEQLQEQERERLKRADEALHEQFELAKLRRQQQQARKKAARASLPPPKCGPARLPAPKRKNRGHVIAFGRETLWSLEMREHERMAYLPFRVCDRPFHLMEECPTHGYFLPSARRKNPS